ncbi:MAG: 3-hydroxyacyl-CoA dehydrogenase [Burkholderiaceae bacterium]
MTQPFKKIGVAGAGAMGRGIVQLYAQAGFPVALYDTQPAVVAAALKQVRDTFDMLVQKGRLSREKADAASAGLTALDSPDGFADCDLVIEAIIERLDIKREFFAKLESVLAPDAVIVTNTSSLSVTALAAGRQHPERVAGYHFFNPVPLMKVVEVVAAPRTAPSVIERLVELTRVAGHTPVVAQDTPGFIVNHAGRGFGTEALKTLGEGVADIPGIDRIMREQALFNGQGFKLGPFELLDLTGLDVSHAVMESIFNQYYQEPRFRPSVIGTQRVAAGLFGRKVKEGFYDYSENASAGAGALPEQPVPNVGELPRVWVDPAQREALAELVTELGASVDDGKTPAGDSLILLAPLGLDASTAAVRAGVDATRVVAVDTLFPFAAKGCKRRTLMTTPATSAASRDAAHALLARDGAKVTVIRDSAGFVAQRIAGMIIAIGCEIAQQRIASPEDIDVAVRLGLGYPCGPLAMGDVLGPQRVMTLLNNMHAVTLDPRYRPSLWLQRRAQLGLSLLQAD